MTGQFSIQAGILARASGDTLIVEEFDKKENKAEFGVLNEAMTKFEYTVTKAGKHRSFRCNTTIVVVANPEGKKFDMNQSIIPQIDISGDLLSRFTVISAIFDRADIDIEEQINKVMLERGNTNLLEQDKKKAEYIKKCIKVASDYDPKMDNPKIQEFINNFTQEAVSLKKNLVYEKDIKFWDNYGNRRNRESLIKIIKGVAMLHCHPIPTKEDMLEGLHLFREFMKDVVDYNVLLDPQEIATGKRHSIAEKIERKMKAEELIIVTEEKRETKKGRRELLLERLKHLHTKLAQSQIDETALQEYAINDLKMSDFEFDELIEKMIQEGSIFRPQNNFLRLIT
jgi:DNA replicative helicase MCM subunit Mcm2 (Cdc46/Mcm family)